MFSPRAIFRFIYGSFYFVLCAITTCLLLTTPGDIIYQAYFNSQFYNIWILAACVVLTLVIISFIYALRLFNNKTILASIPKPWVPIEKGDVPKNVFHMITFGLERSAVIAFEARPRERPAPRVNGGGGAGGDVDQMSVLLSPVDSNREKAGDVNNIEDAQRQRRGFQLQQYRRLEWLEELFGSPAPQPRPVWGDIEHNGWSSPNTPDLPNLQYGTVLSELPNLIEAKAITLAPPDPTSDMQPPLLDADAVLLLQRPAHLGLRGYLDHLAQLGVLAMDSTTTDFLTIYEHARFCTRPISNAQFRDLMHLFAALLRNMEPLDPNLLDPIVEDDDAPPQTPTESNADSDAAYDEYEGSPGSVLARTTTQSSRGSRRRPTYTARHSSASTWHNYRTAPSTLKSRSTGRGAGEEHASRSSSLNSVVRTRQPYQSRSNASLRSQASSGVTESSVIRLAGAADRSELPYVLTMMDTR